MTFSKRDFIFAGLGATAYLVSRCRLATAAAAAPAEGYAPVAGGRVWWRILGSGPRTPLLLLHGGPGAGHDYLEPLSALADDRPVIFYDQLGCGLSDKPDDVSLWHIAHFADEIDALRRSLGLHDVILFGHSSGGWLAQEYLASRGSNAGVSGLILASTSASVDQFVVGAERLLARMPGDFDAQRRHYESTGQTDTPAYQNLVEQFYEAHLVHLDGPKPPYLTRAFDNLATSRTYSAMNGPNEFTVTGTLKGWDRSSALSKITIPTSVLTSEWDEVTRDCHDTLHRGIRNSRMTVIPGARHLAMIEKPNEYIATIRDFLSTFA